MNSTPADSFVIVREFRRLRALVELNPVPTALYRLTTSRRPALPPAQARFKFSGTGCVAPLAPTLFGPA